MKLTTLCYIQKDNCYLMLHRIKKSQDINEGKWIGVGGKFEADETPEECLLREVKEETGLTLLQYQYRGLLTFINSQCETEYIFLYTADAYEGTLASDCGEGILEWVPIDQIDQLNLWEGDRIFLRYLKESTAPFSLKLKYEGDVLVETRELLMEM